MRRCVAGLLLALLAACSTNKDLNFLERESLEFKASNETIRAEDLEQEYEKQRRRADTLSEQVLAVGRERDRLFATYDDLRAATARSQRQLAEQKKQKAALDKAVRQTNAEMAKLKKQLEEARKQTETLRKEIAAERAKREALEAERAGKKAPE